MFAGRAAAPPPWGVWDVVKGTALGAGMMVAGIAAFALAFGGDDGGGAGDAEFLAIGLAAYGAMAACVWAFTIRKYGCGLGALGFRRVRAFQALALPALALGASWAFSIAYTFLAQEFLGESFIPDQNLDELLGGEDIGPLAFAEIALLGPIAEEIYFRGFALAALAAKFGAARGAALSAAFFAAAHFNFSVMPILFFIGMALAWLYLKTGSLWPPIAAHIAQNSLALFSYQVLDA